MARTIFLLASLCLLYVYFNRTDTAHADAPDASVTPLELRVDQQDRARGFCRGFKVLVSIGGSFEFYDRSLKGGRERMFSGPWRGTFRVNSPGTYSLAGHDTASGAEYLISITQRDQYSIDLQLSFKTPSRTSGLEFEVVKLASDVFKGGDFVVIPASVMDAKGIPIAPRFLKNRMLLSDKSRILVRGALCDIEIEDLTGRKTIYAADGRNMSWDRHKSISFGVTASNLAPGSRQEFRFRIRSLPPSRQLPAESSPAVSGVNGQYNAWSFFSIPPKYETKMTGSYGLKGGDVIFGSLSGTADAILSQGIEQMTGMRLPLQTLNNAQPMGRGIYIERVSRKDRPDIRPEGFEIAAEPDRVTVRAVDERGCLYGVYALMGRIVKHGDVWEIACGQIRDWPDLPIRGVCTELLAPAVRDVNIMKRYLDAFSRARSNTVVFLHNPLHLRSWMKNKDDGRWTKDQMTEIVRYARWLHLDVWGGMGSGFKRQDFPEMEIQEGTNFYSPFEEKNYRYLFSLYDEILTTYGPATLLISHDEIQGLEVYAKKAGKSTAELLTYDVRRIHDHLASKRVRTAMWGDMLLDHETWEAKVGSANSRNPFFRSGATHLALKDLPKDVFILDWHYDPKIGYGSIGYFRENGFSVAGATWHDPHAAKSLVGSIKSFGGQGIIATDFGFWRTMSPTAATLYASLCGWSVHCRIDETQNDVLAMAETVRDPLYAGVTGKQTAIDLRSTANRATYAPTGETNKGPFDAGGFLDLRGVHTGRQQLGGIVFDIAPDGSGRNNNTVVVMNTQGSDGSLTGAMTVFRGDAKARHIAFLHTAFVKEPIRDVRRLGQYRIEYSDGIHETIEILENWNITDVRSSEGLRRNAWTYLRTPDVLIGSKRVWQGYSATGIPLNLQLILWENPHPGKDIRSIQLLAGADPKGSRIALLGLTFLQQ